MTAVTPAENDRRGFGRPRTGAGYISFTPLDAHIITQFPRHKQQNQILTSVTQL